MRENCTSRLSERAEAGRKSDLSRLYSCEADEQSGAIRCGAGGAKDGDQGERGPAKHAPRAQDRESVSQALERVRQAARRGKKEKFTSLLHHVDTAMLRTAFYAMKRDAAPGVDGMIWETYERDLDRRIEGIRIVRLSTRSARIMHQKISLDLKRPFCCINLVHN